MLAGPGPDPDSSAPTSADGVLVPLRLHGLAATAALTFASLALARFRTFHNETYDLAFYARLAWGLGHGGDRWQPLVNADLLGLHASWVLYPLGWLGRVLPLIPLLLAVQAACVAVALVPLARIAIRRTGHPLAGDVAAASYLLFPAVAQAAVYEFHPGTLAVAPLAFALDHLDQRDLRGALVPLALAVACREDVSLLAACCGLSVSLHPSTRRAGIALFAAGTAYFALYQFGVAPRYLPAHGSLQMHFGGLGATPSQVLAQLVLHPVQSGARLLTPEKIRYVPRLLLPVAFVPLFAPRWLLPALPVVAINLLSSFPSAVRVNSHYALLAVPFLFASAAQGAGRIAARVPGNVRAHAVLALLAVLVLAGSSRAQVLAGALPLSRRWRTEDHLPDARSRAALRILSQIPDSEGVIVPDALLAHVAERREFQRIPWQRHFDHLVLDVSYRSRADLQGRQELWRCDEEVLTRNVLAGLVVRTRDYGLVDVAYPYAYFRRGHAVRHYAEGRYVDVLPETDAGFVREHAEGGPSFAVAGWRVRAAPQGSGTEVTVLLAARRTWPPDVGFEVGWGEIARAHADREDPSQTLAFLPFDGWLSPSRVRPGEVARTRVVVPAGTEALRAHGFWFGARRLDGSRLDPDGPHWIPLGGSLPLRLDRTP